MSISRWLRGLLLVALACFACGAHAQRLPDTVQPTHYQLRLTPHIQAGTFTGSEKIDVRLDHPMDAITLNAAQITFKSVTADLNGQALTATVTEDPQKQQITLHFDRTLPAGPLTLSIEYTGVFNKELRGFYLSHSKHHEYAVTQFEPTDARRAFPSFDEPAYKATFSTALVVPRGDTAISNTNIVSNTPGPGPNEHTLRFATTPRMSTYLVAFLVGDFQCSSGSSDGVPIRVCATPGKVQYTRYALAVAEHMLHYYDTYFGIKYPMPKLDLIALPDFEAGAMENFGAITYRETDLLIDPDTASISAKKRVATVVAHEMAHQWFGDMVTMQWWNNIWLNEGFATWMENKAVAAWKPQWHMLQDVAKNRNDALNLDAQRVTRAIRAPANTPGQINAMFNWTSYDKAGAILRMVENYEGPRVFRKGVQKYLRAHMYANATAQDFWNAQTAVSGKPINKIMASFIAEPGEPMLSFGKPAGGRVTVSQERFFLSSNVKPSRAQTWSIPVCFKGADANPSCDVMDAASQSLAVPSSPFLFANADGVGYYRSRYTPAVYKRIASHVETSLTPIERIGFLGDEWANVRSGEAPVGRYLDLAASVRDDSSADVIDTALHAVQQIDNQIASTPQEHEALARWTRRNFQPAYDSLGAPTAGDSPAKKELRATLFQYLGSIGADPEIIAQAKVLAESYLKDPSSVEPTLADKALVVAAAHGDAAFFHQLQTIFETANNPELQETALSLLGKFTDPALEERALEFIVSGKVRNQDSAYILAAMLRSPNTNDVAWRFVRHNWPAVKAQTTIMSGERVVSGAGSFCTVERRAQVVDFFTAHPLPATRSSLTEARDRISDCISLRTEQGVSFRAWAARQ